MYGLDAAYRFGLRGTGMNGLPSYVSGTSDQPLLYCSVGGVLSDAAQKWPDGSESGHPTMPNGY